MPLTCGQTGDDMTKVIRLEPHSAAVFFSIDSDPGFGIRLCNDATLFSAVHQIVFNKAPDDDSRAEVADIVEALRTTGGFDFEDGWIALRTGMAAVTEFLMEQLVNIKGDEHFADKQRCEE
jgi:hypothetical protein